jgi:two-component system sensor histidine kinase EvgS
LNRRSPPRRRCLAGLLLAVVPILLPAAPVLRAASELDYPPFAVVDADGRADGLGVELLRAALARVGRDVTFEIGPWHEIKAALAEGRLDVLPLVGRTPEREPLFDFSAPIVVVTSAVAVREDGPSPATLADLRGLEVAVMTGDVNDEYARRHALAGRLVRQRSYTDALRDLSVGRFDAVLAPAPVVRHLIAGLGLSNLRIAPVTLPDLRQVYCFAVREGNSTLLAELDRGLAALHADGDFERISARWLDADRASMRPLWVLAAAAVVAVLLVSAWPRRRRPPRDRRGAA